MRKLRTIYSVLLLFISILTSVGTTFALQSWNKTLANKAETIKIEIGSRDTPNLPEGTVDLDLWVEENTLNQTMPIDTLFVYGGNIYMVSTAGGYNPQWHGLPDNSNVGWWAFISIMLEWVGSQQAYPIGAVVKRDGRFFQARHGGNTNDPLYNHGTDSSGKPWREIQPVEDYMFPLIPGTTLRNYSIPFPEYIIPI